MLHRSRRREKQENGYFKKQSHKLSNLFSIYSKKYSKILPVCTYSSVCSVTALLGLMILLVLFWICTLTKGSNCG